MTNKAAVKLYFFSQVLSSGSFFSKFPPFIQGRPTDHFHNLMIIKQVFPHCRCLNRRTPVISTFFKSFAKKY
jgi:hypothetical protein